MGTLGLWLWAAALLAAPGDEPGAGARVNQVTAAVAMQVDDAESVKREAVKIAQELGGFHHQLAKARVVLKVPHAAVEPLIERLSKDRVVVQKTFTRQDITDRTRQLEASVRSKTKILAQLRTFFDDSDVAATLQIEQQLLRLVQELEQAKGQLRVAREQAVWAVVDVTLRLPPERQLRYVRSPFEWLNTVDLQRFLREF